jgi:butyrate kinase
MAENPTRLDAAARAGRNAREEAARLGRGLDARLVDLVRQVRPGAEDPVLALLVGEELAEKVRRMRWSSLVINPGSTSTKVTVYNGLTLVADDELHSEPGAENGVTERVRHILAWLKERRLDVSDVTGIASRGGFVAPVFGGTYPVVPAMVEDLARAPYAHAANLSVPIALELAALAKEQLVVTITDPGTVDETELVHRMTGSPHLRSRGAFAHHLNMHAAAQITARVLGRDPGALHVAICHMGGGMSAGRFEDGRMVQVAHAFGDLPSANRCGRLPLHELIKRMESREYSLEDLKREVVASGGGLLALCGTDDFQAFFAFRDAGASPAQARKIDLVTRMYAGKVAGCLLELSADERPLDAVILTGGLARSDRFCAMVEGRIHLAVPLARLPGSVEGAALAAGLLRACADPSKRTSYVAERDRLAAARAEEDTLLETTIFDRPLLHRREGSPPRGMDDIIADARPAGDLPFIVIAGADNEEALLAAKLANMEGSYRLARFLLVGPYARVSELAWELDVPIDEENYFVVDAADPAARAVELHETGAADILMKGSVMTAGLLKAYLGSLKKKGRTGRGPRLSHLSFFDVPGRGKLLGVTDAAMNTNPDLDARVDILDNALEALRLLGIREPRVAVVSATEKPSEAVTSSMEARTIAERFKDRRDLIIEGPLSVDLALSRESAREKGWKGRIQGDADLLLVPNIDVGNAIYKTLTVASGAVTAGAVIGGEGPIILTSRGDSSRSKLASIALALVLSRRGKGRKAT